MTTFAPSARKPRAIALPTPCDPPVIRARRSVSPRSMDQVHLSSPCLPRAGYVCHDRAASSTRAVRRGQENEIVRAESVTIAGSESTGQDHGFLVEPGAAADP